MDQEGIKVFARGIARAPYKERLVLIENLLQDLGKFYGKKQLKQNYVV